MDLDLPPEHAAFRDTVRELAQGVALPLAAEVDRDHRFPEEAVTAAAEAGLLRGLIPREDGGARAPCPGFPPFLHRLPPAIAPAPGVNRRPPHGRRPASAHFWCRRTPQAYG